MTERETFGNDLQYRLRDGDLELTAMEPGATLTGLRYKGRELLLRCGSPEEYLRNSGYLCCAVGRIANRIGGARFSLNGREYRLAANEGSNQLHGGPEAFSKRRWRGEPAGESAVRFTLFSPDGDNGFPGDLTAAVTYRLEGNALHILFEGESGADTVYAPTSHLYFVPAGGGGALAAELRINASRVVEVDRDLIPTGRLLPAEGNLDFRAPRRVGRDYDHCFVLDGGGQPACVLRSGGLEIALRTDFPGVQVYTGSALEPPFAKNAALAIEPEFFPDSPNHPDFPSVLLRAGEKFSRYAEFQIREV